MSLAILIGLAVVVVLLAVVVSRSGEAKNGVERGFETVVREAERIDRTVRDETDRVRSQLEVTFATVLETRLASMDGAQDSRLTGIREDLDRQRSALTQSIDRHAATTAERVTAAVDRNEASFDTFAQQLSQFESKLDGRFETLRSVVDTKLGQIQEENATKLEQMRATVDEKLQNTLERRLGESFALVSQQLEQVQRGLGEMQSLSEGVGDLRRVMSNVKARGVLGEWRLESILEQLMAPEQYAKNVQPVPGSGGVVEFAIRMPRRGDASDVTWLPVDSKFPVEDYERLVAALEAGDKEGVDAARRGLVSLVKKAAKDIRSKYVEPPHTTDYGILFLATEGLFAEVVRQPGLVEEIHREHRVMIAGPTTFATLLNCLQMGFRSVALAERSKEVWNLLGAVRSEFGKFSDAMTAVKKKLEQAHTAVESVEVRTRAMGRKLRSVDELSAADAERLITAGSADEDQAGADECEVVLVGDQE